MVYLKQQIVVLIGISFFHCSEKRTDTTQSENVKNLSLNNSIPNFQSIRKPVRGFLNFDHSIGKFPENTRKRIFGYDESTLFKVDTICSHEFIDLIESLRSQIANNKTLSFDDDFAFLQVYNTKNNLPHDYRYEGFREDNLNRDTLNMYFKKRQAFYDIVVSDEYCELQVRYLNLLSVKYRPIPYHRNKIFYPKLNILSDFMYCNNCSCFYINFDCVEAK
jgi:hypothetical protein